MSYDWENTFRAWAKPLSDTAQTKCENAERMIRAAIRERPTLQQHTIEVFPQGSYRNNTNVREDSDVDICVRYMDAFFSDFTFAQGFTSADIGLTDAAYPYSQFKADVEAALVQKFGRRGVTRGKKAFDIHENTYRIDADVVACFEHRRYTYRRVDGSYAYQSGTEFIADDGPRIINWPQQQYDNGVTKNTATSRRFKAVVRIIKSLCNQMVGEGIDAAKPIPSFLIECLVWNVPNNLFVHDTYAGDVRKALIHLYQQTKDDSPCSEWGEVSECKYLFRSGQPWTRVQANAFVVAAWQYLGFT
ncbi:MAG: nucleotidyltransferase [Deltaproteobacteria bacterium]|nr:nucleotidyltransferase [Deltaproteobacteria bacterium]